MQIKMMTRGAAGAALLVTTLAMPALGGPVEDARKCAALTGPSNAAEAIVYCTQALNSAMLSKKVRKDSFIVRGNAYRYQGQYDKAVKDFDEALLIETNSYDARFGRGLAYAAAKDYQKAIKDFDDILALNSDNAPAYYERGNVYAAMGDYGRAIQDYDQAIRLQPQDADAYYARGMARSRLAQGDLAIADFNQAMALGGDPMIRRLQSYLKAQGKYRARIDGKFGRLSKAALRACVKDPGC